MSLENICAIDGMVNDVPREILKVISSIGLNLKESFGSNDEKLSTFSYLAANRKPSDPKNSCSPSKKAPYLFLLSSTF